MNRHIGMTVMVGVTMLGLAGCMGTKDRWTEAPCSATQTIAVRKVVVAVAKEDGGTSTKPSVCYVKPGQRLEWQGTSGSISMAINFATGQYGPQPGDRTPDEKSGYAWFRQVMGTTPMQPIEITVRSLTQEERDQGICPKLPYKAVANAGSVDPNPSIIIKPDNMQCRPESPAASGSAAAK